MRKLWVLIACGAAQAVAADADSVKLLPSPLEMPRRIGPMISDGSAHSFEDPRLGKSYRYGGKGLLLHVYVYDAGLENIPDGADSIATCRQFEDAKAGVVKADYRDISLKAEQLVRLAPPNDAPLAREAVFELVRDGRQTISYVWITAVAKHFVKLRFTLDAELRDELPEARRAVLDVLGAALGPHLEPVDAGAKKPGATMNLTLDDTGDATAFMYGLLLTNIAGENEGQGPVCGGPFLPSYDIELGVYRGLVDMQNEGASSRFGKRLASIAAAGFLEEFVWTDLHREEWGSQAPEGLTLVEYNTWKKKHLKRFRRPSLGSVVIDHPRPMPLEASETP
jgi:hypothetical protein